MKLFDSELKVMEALWKNGPMYAAELAAAMVEDTGWNKNTTYTVIKKCIKKGAVRRTDPSFLCTPLVSREEIQNETTDELIDKLFDGSAELFFAHFVRAHGITEQKIDDLKKIVAEHE